MACLKQEISEGVYVGNCLMNPIDNFACISILNSTESSVKFESFNLITETLDNYGVLHINKDDIDYERIKRVKSEERESILGICTEFNDLFFLGDKLTYTNTVTHKIPTKHSNPVHTRQHRLPHQQKLEIERQVEQMLKDDIISPSKSPYNSLLLLYPKKPGANGNKKWRVVVDSTISSVKYKFYFR
ncbi:hypothetical protein JTB14_014371 [Gonioctena quinquepunctata]|nr:hypothetical protein JTB14_014371 [Gonioctena quinquepunctata]